MSGPEQELSYHHRRKRRLRRRRTRSPQGRPPPGSGAYTSRVLPSIRESENSLLQLLQLLLEEVQLQPQVVCPVRSRAPARTLLVKRLLLAKRVAHQLSYNGNSRSNSSEAVVRDHQQLAALSSSNCPAPQQQQVQQDYNANSNKRRRRLLRSSNSSIRHHRYQRPFLRQLLAQPSERTPPGAPSIPLSWVFASSKNTSPCATLRPRRCSTIQRRRISNLSAPPTAAAVKPVKAQVPVARVRGQTPLHRHLEFSNTASTKKPQSQVTKTITSVAHPRHYPPSLARPRRGVIQEDSQRRKRPSWVIPLVIRKTTRYFHLDTLFVKDTIVPARHTPTPGKQTD